MRKNKSVLYVRNLTPGVRNMFKSKCYAMGDDMQIVTEALMRLYLEKPSLVAEHVIRVRSARKKKDHPCHLFERVKK